MPSCRRSLHRGLWAVHRASRDCERKWKEAGSLGEQPGGHGSGQGEDSGLIREEKGRFLPCKLWSCGKSEKLCDMHLCHREKDFKHQPHRPSPSPGGPALTAANTPLLVRLASGLTSVYLSVKNSQGLLKLQMISPLHAGARARSTWVVQRQEGKWHLLCASGHWPPIYPPGAGAVQPGAAGMRVPGSLSPLPLPATKV